MVVYAIPRGEDEPSGVIVRVAQILLAGSVILYFPLSLFNPLPKTREANRSSVSVQKQSENHKTARTG